MIREVGNYVALFLQIFSSVCGKVNGQTPSSANFVQLNYEKYDFEIVNEGQG